MNKQYECGVMSVPKSDAPRKKIHHQSPKTSTKCHLYNIPAAKIVLEFDLAPYHSQGHLLFMGPPLYIAISSIVSIKRSVLFEEVILASY